MCLSLINKSAQEFTVSSGLYFYNGNSYIWKQGSNVLLHIILIILFVCLPYALYISTGGVIGKCDIFRPFWVIQQLWSILLKRYRWYQTVVVQFIPRNMHTVLLCFALFVVMHSFIMNSHEVFIHIHQGCFAGTGAIVRLPQCQWSKPDGYGKISQCITTTKHSKAKIVCIFLGIYL